MKRYLPLVIPGIAAVSVGCLMVIGWHVTDLIEPEELRIAVRLVSSLVWVMASMAVLGTRGEDIFGRGPRR